MRTKKESIKNVTSVLLALTVFMPFLPVSVFANTDTLEEDYELRVLTFEDKGNDTYWAGRIPKDQYSDSLLYGGTAVESEAYKWYDAGNTELSHTLPFNYGTYNYWGGGHAISNYASTDFETYGDYMSQLTVFKDAEYEEGVMMREGGGHNGSDNFAVHFGYADESGFNGMENLPALVFADGQARVIDHMYVNITTYPLCCFLTGNGFTEPLGENDWVKIIATGYNGNTKTSSTEFYLANLEESVIVTDWTLWDLSTLGEVTKVEFNMAGSSDNGYGFSQPSYFAYDDVAVRFENTSSSDIQISDIYVLESEKENIYEYYYYVGTPENTSGKAILALYSGKKLVGMDIKDITNGDNDVFGSITTSKTPDNYKIMLWNGTENLIPLCNAVTGDIN